MSYLTLEQLIAVDDRAYEDVYVPEWGGNVRLKGLTKQEQLDIRREALVGGEVDPGRVEMLALVKCLEEPALTSEQVGVLMTKQAAVVNRLLKRVAVLAGLNEEEAQKEAMTRFREGPGAEV